MVLVSRSMVWMILLSWIFFVPQIRAQENCRPPKKVIRSIESLFGNEQGDPLMILPFPEADTSKHRNPGDCLYRISEQDIIRGYLLSTRARGRFEDFDYSVIFSADKAVRQVIITAYRSTHGAAICQKKWLSQFDGYSGGELELGKDIDGVSGGTISATALIRDLGRCHGLISSLNME